MRRIVRPLAGAELHAPAPIGAPFAATGRAGTPSLHVQLASKQSESPQAMPESDLIVERAAHEHLAFVEALVHFVLLSMGGVLSESTHACRATGLVTSETCRRSSPGQLGRFLLAQVGEAQACSLVRDWSLAMD